MHRSAMVIAGLVILPAVGLLIWSCLTMVGVKKELRALNGFDGMHFEV